MNDSKKTDPIKIAVRRQREACRSSHGRVSAAKEAEREKTARLKALRLAREAARQVANPSANKPKAAGKRR
jgi:hypothetical protein